MAKITEKRAQPEPPPVIGYTLELTVQEAECLRHALGNSDIAGPCINRSATLLHNIFKALDDKISWTTGVPYSVDFKTYLDLK